MPLIGFQCPNKVVTKPSFTYCITTCSKKCMSLPLLLALMRDKDVEEGVYSITELPNPRQQVYLKRHSDYWINPFFSTFALFGTAVHSIIESQKDKIKDLNLDKAFIIEDRKRVDFNGVTVSGRADLYDVESKTVYDYKTIKAYAMRKMLDGEFEDNSYALQLNGYRYFFYPEAEHLIIEAFVKDWSYAIMDSSGMKPLERVEVPMLSDMLVAREYQKLIDGHLKVERTGEVPPCTRAEVWFNENPRSPQCGAPIRCRDYCEVNAVCKQYESFQLETDDGARKRIYPKK